MYRFLIILFFVYLSTPLLAVNAVIVIGEDEFEIIIKDGKKGLRNAKGKTVIPVIYDDLGWSDGSSTPIQKVIGFKQDGKWGLITISNKKRTEPIYHNLLPTSIDLIVASKSKSSSKVYGLINEKGEEHLPFQYHSLEEFKGIFISSVDNTDEDFYKLIDESGADVLSDSFKSIDPLMDSMLVLTSENRILSIYHVGEEKIIVDEFSRYDSLGDLILLINGSKKGLIDHNGHIISPIDYKEFKVVQGELQGQKFNQWLVLNQKQKEIGQIDADSIRFEKDKIILQEELVQTLVSSTGKQITPGFISDISAVSGYHVVYKENGKYAAYDALNKKIVAAEMDSIVLENEFYYYMSEIQGKSIWTIKDTFQTERTKYQYELIRPHHNRLFAVKRNNKWGFIQRNGFEVIPCAYDSVGRFIANDVIAVKNDQQGILSVNGKWTIEPTNEKLELISHIHFISRRDGITKLYRTNGQLIYTTNNAVQFKEGVLWEFRADGTIMKIDLKGNALNFPNELNLAEFEEIKYLDNFWVAVKQKGKFGFFDTQIGRMCISTRYEDVGRAINPNFITVKILGKWGAINSVEQLTVQPNYDSIYGFNDGVAITTRNGKYGLISDDASIVVENDYDFLYKLSSGRYLSKRDDAYGLIDKSGKLLIVNKYDYLEDNDNGYVVVRKGTRWGVVDLQGINIIPMIYDEIRYNAFSGLYYLLTANGWETLQ